MGTGIDSVEHDVITFIAVPLRTSFSSEDCSAERPGVSDEGRRAGGESRAEELIE